VNKGKKKGRGPKATALGRDCQFPYSLLGGSPLLAERLPSYGTQIHQLAWIWLGLGIQGLRFHIIGQALPSP
jgi:hypothetical protein